MPFAHKDYFELKALKEQLENAAPEKTIGAPLESVSPILSRNSYFMRWINDGIIIPFS